MKKKIDVIQRIALVINKVTRFKEPFSLMKLGRLRFKKQIN